MADSAPRLQQLNGDVRRKRMGKGIDQAGFYAIQEIRAHIDSHFGKLVWPRGLEGRVRRHLDLFMRGNVKL